MSVNALYNWPYTAQALAGLEQRLVLGVEVVDYALSPATGVNVTKYEIRDRDGNVTATIAHAEEDGGGGVHDPAWLVRLRRNVIYVSLVIGGLAGVLWGLSWFPRDGSSTLLHLVVALAFSASMGGVVTAFAATLALDAILWGVENFRRILTWGLIAIAAVIVLVVLSSVRV